jgi:hypothetical protein
MELEKRIAKIERLPLQIAKVAGAFLAAMAVITIGIFEFAKLVKYLWMSF